MKKFFLCLAFFLGSFSIFGQKTMTLSFVGKNALTQNDVILDSVFITNLSLNGDTTLYKPVTALKLLIWYVGTRPEYKSEGEFMINRNFPNPFLFSTKFSIYREYSGPINIVLSDGLGRKVAEYNNNFDKGCHLFEISSSGNKVLILTVYDEKNNKSIKIIGSGQGQGKSAIQYIGQTSFIEQTPFKSLQNTGFHFYMGNYLRYTAYAKGTYNNTITDNPVHDTTYYFSFNIFDIPSVTTNALTSITQATANSGGNVISDGGSPVTARGVCWSLTPNPTISNNYSVNGNGTGTFTSFLSGLNPNTSYNIRAYATNNIGTAYGNELSFTTLPTPVLPIVNTSIATNISQNLATSGGNVIWDGGSPVTVRGVCWSLKPTPTLADNYSVNGNGTGSFSSSLYALEPNTLYSVRAYATNSVGTSYGNEIYFKTLATPAMPAVSTTNANSITPTTASSGGNVTSQGSSAVTARGVCWSTSANPTIADPHTSDGSGTGGFTSNITGLTQNTPYFVRAYATSSVGTAYGNEISFTTLITPVLPALTTTAASSIAQTTAASGGNVTSQGSSAVTARGVCWSTSANPTIADPHTSDGSGTGAFTSNITGLTQNTPYFVRAYATSTVGTVYGNEISFTTLVTPVLPVVTTTAASSIAQTTAASGGNVTSQGSSAVTARGVCWSTSANPTIADPHTSDGNGTGSFSSNITGLTQNTPYFVRAYATNTVGTAYGNEVRFTTFETPALPVVSTTAASGITLNTASSGGNVTSQGTSAITARGVCWSTSVNPTISDSHTTDGSGTGVFISSLTGLTPNTPYHIRAYATNSAGTAYGSDLGFTTLATGFNCGSTITITHVAGTVAPVTKTVTYGTVTNIPGEPSKCWITSNLGADHQATSVDDPTEASAGWYWQFNRKQGYKYDGTTRTPNTTYNTSIDENSEWLASNDPCTIELGGGWRLPTNSEWTNVDATGDWSGWDAPWNSLLKLHAGGYLHGTGGILYNRDYHGIFQSNSQQSTSWGRVLSFVTSMCHVTQTSKSDGHSVRCIKDSPNSSLPTVTTTAATTITQTTATSGGEITSDGGAFVTVKGVCWSTSANPTISDSHTTDGNGTGVFVSSLTGLTPNTPYHIRAYATNSAGTAYGSDLSFTTLAWTCGSTITINHIEGTVAPVTKTVTYGTVTNIPGETAKCWITSNLGANRQATALDDATEASAGWYWQFNRKQGYKHDGTARTPNTTWINPINENSDWITANDPCSIELGNGWRIPTKTEWYNVDATGSWTSWNDAWNSNLKLHLAGHLADAGGALRNRGIDGHYYSNTMSNNANSWYLVISASGSGVFDYYKAYSFSLRCIKDSPNPSLPTVTTTAATTITQTTATSGGEITSDGGALVTARGVCWSTSANPTTTDSHTSDGGGSGMFVSSITGLTPNTPYHIRAYATNSAGTAYGSDLNFTTLAAGFTCGSTIMINHVAGDVAAVSKTVNYGTVTNIPGEPSKCWITSNLGADRQSVAADDATEASAGWYWQFNRKQGYKNDGTTRTPNTTWINPINENSDWIPANDPCSIELGSGWRIPTITEWTNIDESGNWLSMSDTWLSSLKIHASGLLTFNNGSLQDRGVFGYYWSSMQFSEISRGKMLIVGISGSGPWDNRKEAGFTLRCVKDSPNPSLPTVTTTAATSITQTTATSGGEVTSDGGALVTARGVCWSNSANPTTTDIHTSDGGGSGMFVSSITGLSSNTPYHIRAYATNSAGTAYGSDLSFTTLADEFTCGSTITINHVAGDVAAVAKNVNYGTVTNIPGEESKCWITSNLGADRQATKVDDDTEASAGWYWQFNRKQGYKHDGTTRTPNTSWINLIDEDSDWIPANDPCSLELGGGWRIPTSSEFANVIATGNWTDWNGPWNSGLKLHAGGELLGTSGDLNRRGSSCLYWSSKQLSSPRGIYLYFQNGYGGYFDNAKVDGYTVRCIKDGTSGE